MSSRLEKSSTFGNTGAAECANPGTGTIWSYDAGWTSAATLSAICQVPSSEIVVRFAWVCSASARVQVQRRTANHSRRKENGGAYTLTGVEGMEYAHAPRVTHEVTLPFTRLLAGPADYTPVLFDKGLNGTTWANQIATAVIMTSPLLNFAANPTTIVSNPAVSILRAIPSIWDETVVLPPSKIGELAIFARRKGTTWFLAVTNGATPRTVSIPLTFLKNHGYTTELARDTPDNPASITMQHQSYRKTDSIDLNLSPGGGFVAKFSF